MSDEIVEHWTPVCFIDGDSIPYVETPTGAFVRLDSLIGGASADTFQARCICYANVPNLNAFQSDAGTDDIALQEGDVVLLALQTTKSQNGPYVVGVVDPDTAEAALTRPDWWATGNEIETGIEILVGGEGTYYKNTQWAVMAAADSITVDTDDPVLYPRVWEYSAKLVAGTSTFDAPVFSLNSFVSVSRTEVDGNISDTVSYQPTTGGTTGLIPGPVVGGHIVVNACLANGLINAADASFFNVVLVNQQA